LSLVVVPYSSFKSEIFIVSFYYNLVARGEEDGSIVCGSAGEGLLDIFIEFYFLATKPSLLKRGVNLTFELEC